ncbi:hypothetical protein T09_7324 [Trichinella sp. T9]|nr:hypothetical protein T09_7324 [Trichinella sp. T9]
MRTGEPAERCQVEAHSFYYQQLNVLKMPVAGDPSPVFEIYDELASNASTSLATAAHFPTWEQARNTMYYSRSKRYPRLPLPDFPAESVYFSATEKSKRMKLQ